MKYHILEDRATLYKSEDIQDCIVKFMKTDIGNRCRVRFLPKVGNFKSIAQVGEDEKFFRGIQAFTSLSESNIYRELYLGTSHFLEHLFSDDTVKNGKRKCPSCSKDENRKKFREYAESQYCGINYTVDIDAPQLYPEIRGNTERHDFFEPSVIEQFNEVTELVSERLDSVVDISNSKVMFSGNGFYFVCEDFCSDDLDEISDWKNVIQEELYKVDVLLKRRGNPITIGAKSEGWNRYYKLPFAAHRKLPRIAIPLNNNQIGDIDSEWLDRASKINNLVRLNPESNKYGINSKLIKEIINKSGW